MQKNTLFTPYLLIYNWFCGRKQPNPHSFIKLRRHTLCLICHSARRWLDALSNGDDTLLLKSMEVKAYVYPTPCYADEPPALSQRQPRPRPTIA